ncbi:MAG: deoxyguanosinetriphosphate triphosphohydrolase [Lachnospiraceae bacterium]|nr:deoxyguanosinetriphosphate triphosphohydrolase [Lachnospiraceae bacterium]MBQ7506784.1 deoxyguanosinetriphosphate triphosphohydrolase [Lachnospiraceae bacterium]
MDNGTANIREMLEELEEKTLSPYAAKSKSSRGREAEEPPCPVRPVYQRDRDRILHCKAFRRLKNKTQVFLNPKGDHYRTRMSHTLEVSQNARTIAKALRLNEDLAEAIALGHDLGHTPFGHAGESVLDQALEGGFRHNEQSVRVVERIEKEGKGLNLTWEVRDGILNHEMDTRAATLEGRIVRLSDKISYVNADIDDAIRGNILREEDIPKEITDVLGISFRQRLNTLVVDIICQSSGRDDIRMSPDVEKALWSLRRFLFDNVYKNPEAKGEETKAKDVVAWLFDYFVKHPEKMPPLFQGWIEQEGKERIAADYVAGMTDEYAIRKFKEYTIPRDWQVL